MLLSLACAIGMRRTAGAGLRAAILVLLGALCGRPGLDTPRGAWAALLYYALLAVLALGCAIPHRPVTERPAGAVSPPIPLTNPTAIDTPV